MENFVVTITFLFIGMALKRLPDFPSETGRVLNLFVIYISLPALVILKIPELIFSQNLLVPAFMPWAILLFSCAVILSLSKLLKWNRATTGCLLLLIPLGNTSFLGIPMVKAFFGDQAIPYALLYDQLGSFLALATYGSLILALYGTGKSTPTIKSVAKKIISFPPFIALILAFAIKTLPYPPVAVSILKLLSSTLVPLVMIAVGFQLTLSLDREMISQLSIGLFIKLIAAPATALLLCRIVGLQGEAVQVSIFEAGMPPMVSAGALAILANLSPTLTAALVGIGIILSFITLPILYQFLT
ncbi:MAG: AEC family transporter [Desulfobulbaceae bacterium]|nr:AEC family transporter [Desulfobulbaceae bacterium]HIJ90809.1 AEC family transporter [Deltaproteobacteria bacterium]